MRMLFLAAALAAAGLHAQDMPPEDRQVDLPAFNCDILCYATASSDTARLDVYVQMPHEMLSFSKEGDAFRASYEVSVIVEDSSGGIVAERTWTEAIVTRTYGEASSERAGKVSSRTLSLRPGDYTVKVRATDLDTKKTARADRKIRVRDFAADAFAISDVMLVSRLTAEAGKKVVVPNISGNVWNQTDKLFLYFQAYNRTAADSVRLVLEVRDTKGFSLEKDTLVQPLKGATTSCFMSMSAEKLPAGECTIEVRPSLAGSKSDSAQARIAAVTKKVLIRWRAVPVSISDIDLAIDQMIYTCDRDTLTELKKLPADEKRRRFLAYWQRRSPNPASNRNEIMDEYYSRVGYANKNFTTYQEGWRTDRGMIYIIFGPPSNVERHPFESDTRPYEVWTYYEGNRQFVFIDRTGFGDYRLQNPGYDVWRSGYH